MRLSSNHQTSQKKRAHSAMEIGAANKTPRMKLGRRGARRRMRRDLAGSDESSILIALSIMVIDLLLLAEKFHKGILVAYRWTENALITRKFPANAKSSARRVGHGWHVRLARNLGRELEDLAFVVCLAFVPKRRNSRSMHQAIAIRARSQRFRHPGIILRIAGFTCMCLMAPRLALAEAPEVVTPIEMFDPDSGEGVRVSPSFVLYPQATVDFTYNTNIYNVDAQKIDDGVVSFKPAFVLRSDFSRHAVSLEGGAEIRRYFDISDENSEQYRLNGRALLELGSDINVEAFAGYARGIEQRGTVGDVFFTDEPVRYHEKRAGIEIARTGHRLEMALAGGIAKRDYSDTLSGGVPIDLSLRDVTVRTAKFRTDFGLDAKTKIFAEISGNEIDYQLPTTLPRDSSGYAALVGARHELTALLDVEAGVGYIHQDFKNPSVQSAGEFNYRLAASWTPSPQWRLTASATRLVDASRSQESPAIITNEFKLGAQRAIGDRALVGAEAGYVEEDYRASPRKDKRAFVSASTTYRLTDRIGAFVSAGYRDQDGGAAGRSYKGFAGSVGLRAAW